MLKVFDDTGPIGHGVTVPLGSGRELRLSASYPTAVGVLLSRYSSIPLRGLVMPYQCSPRLAFYLLTERFEDMLDRPAVPRGDGPSGLRPTDKDFAKGHPTLWAWLTDDTWKGGEVRQRSSLLIFAEDDQLKACLMNKDDKMSLWASGASLAEVLACLEGRLKDPRADWRRMRDHDSRNGSKKR